jgi:hypothetical protein
MLSEAARPPVDAGVKVTMMVQEPETAIVPALAHVPPVRAKSVGFGPVRVKNGVARTSEAVPTLDTVIVMGELVEPCNWFPNAPIPGEKLRTGTAGATPVPVRLTSLGLEAAFVAKRKVAVLAPIVVGEKTTFSVQVADAASVPPQVLPLVENWPASAPMSEMLEIVSVAVPGFESVTAWLPLDVPVVWFPNAMLVGETEASGATPVPVSESSPFTRPKIFRLADRAPAAVGVNVRFTVQEPLTAMVPPLVQVPVPAFTNSLAFVPVMVKYGFCRTSAAVPVFVMVMVSGELVVLMF